MEQKPKEVCQKRFGGTTCCVPNCSSNSLRTPGVSFHKFPKETSLKQTWLNLLGISKQPLKSHKVCYLHFPSGKKVLGALPTSNLFSNRQTCNSKIGKNVEQMKTVNQCAHSKNVPTNESTSSEISVLKSELEQLKRENKSLKSKHDELSSKYQLCVLRLEHVIASDVNFKFSSIHQKITSWLQVIKESFEGFIVRKTGVKFEAKFTSSDFSTEISLLVLSFVGTFLLCAH